MLWAKHTCVPSTVNIKPWLCQWEHFWQRNRPAPTKIHTHTLESSNLCQLVNWFGQKQKSLQTLDFFVYLVCPCQVRGNCRWFEPSIKGTVSRWARLWLTVYAQHGCFLQNPSQNELWLGPLFYSLCWLGPLFYSLCSTSIQYCYDAAEELVYWLKLVFNWEMALGEGPIYRMKEWTERRGTSMWMVSEGWSPVSPTLDNSENLSHWPILHGTEDKRDVLEEITNKKSRTAH